MTKPVLYASVVKFHCSVEKSSSSEVAVGRTFLSAPAAGGRGFRSLFCPIIHIFILSCSLNAAEIHPPAASATPTVSIAAEDEAAILGKIQEHGPRDVALEKGLSFLVTQQNKDGSFGGSNYKIALTGLAIMAFLATGNSPDVPPYGPSVHNAINYVISQMRPDGYFGVDSGSGMYGHGICTLMLAEAAGMTRDPVLERALIASCGKAVKLILAAQAIKKKETDEGGWRYTPDRKDSDVSLSGWQTMALRSAKNIGIDVPDNAIQKAVAYIRRSACVKGGFSYQNNVSESIDLRGMGLLVLPICGVYDAPELIKTTKLMLKDPPNWEKKVQGYFYYGLYYAAAGMYQMGDDVWSKFYGIIDDILIKYQRPDGSWPDPPGNTERENFGASYTTSMAILALAVHNHFLPIYQR